MTSFYFYNPPSYDFVCERSEDSDYRRYVDGILKKLLQNKEVFASAVNYAIFEGKEVVKSESLSEKNTEKIYEEINNKQERLSIKRERDILMEESVIQEDEKASYMVIGVENQLHIDYSMFARAMLYDSLDYLSEEERKHKGVATIVIY